MTVRPASHRCAARALRLPIAATAAAVLALGPASAAWAHIHPDPAAVEAGTEATVGFAVEHGCDGSPTTKVEIQMPEGSTGISGVDGDGFTSSVDDLVVTFEGGPLDAETEKSFEVNFTAPDEPGEVPVKIVQTCEEGQLDWIEVAADGEEEPDHPAPMLTITEGTPTEEDGDHHAEDHTESTETTAADDHHAEESTATTVAGDDHHAEEGATEEDDDSSSAPLIIGGIVLLAAVGGGGYALAKRNASKGSGPSDGSGDSPDAA